jgi:malic enzyme
LFSLFFFFLFQFIYPGIGLAAVAVGAKRISDEMFAKAAETLSFCLGEGKKKK